MRIALSSKSQQVAATVEALKHTQTAKSPMISDFIEVRRDGREIPEGTSVLDLIHWGSSKITEVRWRSDGQIVALRTPEGSLNQVLPTRDGVAQIAGAELTLLSEDGTAMAHAPPSMIDIDGSRRACAYLWFEQARPGSFDVVVELESGVQRRVRLDATSGEQLGRAYEHR